MYDGTTFKIGGQEWVIPALSLASLRKFSETKVLEKLGTMTAQPTPEQIDAAVVVIHTAMSRNYPGTSAEQVAEMVDLGNFAPVLKAIFGQSGVETVPAGEAMSP